ncbi:papain fold toxin domain-containing protein [Nostoc sp.]|uniref:papain fold toxin domain-containing protein n=1 Tax=Nostoc sp. TaxID=1180 RepID=UPI002FF4E7A8
MRQLLIDQNISGKQVSLFTGSTEEPFCNIYHKRLQQNISINGRHEAIAVEIDDIYFCSKLRSLLFYRFIAQGTTSKD